MAAGAGKTREVCVQTSQGGAAEGPTKPPNPQVSPRTEHTSAPAKKGTNCSVGHTQDGAPELPAPAD